MILFFSIRHTIVSFPIMGMKNIKTDLMKIITDDWLTILPTYLVKP